MFVDLFCAWAPEGGPGFPENQLDKLAACQLSLRFEGVFEAAEASVAPPSCVVAVGSLDGHFLAATLHFSQLAPSSACPL